MSGFTNEDELIAEEVADTLLNMTWDGVQNTPIIIEMDNFRNHRRNGGTVIEFAKKLIKKYPDYYGEDDLTRVRKQLTYMDEVLGAKRPVKRVNKQDIPHYYGKKLDHNYDGELYKK